MFDAIPGNSDAYSNGSLDNQTQSTYRPANLDYYTIGWICALKVELVAAVELLDVKFSVPPGTPRNDDNVYMCGQMRDHNVVIACLPKDKYGVTAAASVAKDMMRSFIEVHTILMVGIGGGAPSQGHDIKLGDVVVGVPAKELGGVIHYDFGKATQDHGFQRTGYLNSTPTRLLSALQYIKTIHTTCGNQITSAPDPQTDVIFKSSFVHQYHSQDCMQSCIMQTDQIIRQGRPDDTTDGPVIHYGLIASADRLMKDAIIRDHLAETEGVLCFEMETAGLVNRCPCVDIRGICDYSDTHKNDRWQGYAAATAAAYAKELLGVIRVH
ncbi:nucleoside phosphorylase domain-containing protein [Aspergillus venezuelensis]